jgi:hypothetical protein
MRTVSEQRENLKALEPMATRGKAPELLAYMAGVTDSDGWIGINRSLTRPQRRANARYQPQVTIVNTSMALMELFQSEFGGSIVRRQKVKENHKQTYYWRLGDRKAAAYCEQILPYLLVKKEQAKLLIEFMAGVHGAEQKGQGAKLSQEECDRREAIYMRYKALNDDRRYPQRLSETASRTDEAIV